MGISGSLRKLACFLDECGDEGRVSSVEFVEDISQESGGVLTADVEVTVPMCPPEGKRTPVSLCDVSVDSDGVLRFEIESSQAVVPSTDHDIAVEPTDATFDPDGTITLTLSASVLTEENPASDEECEEHAEEQPTESTAISDDSDDDSASIQRDQDIPPFRDPERLTEVYESCDTFTEMPEMLGMDVTAETVRRYMIDYGIHEPDSYTTNNAVDSEDEPQSPVVLADGIGLPDNVTVDTIIETVSQSNTIYEVKRDIGIERENTLEMLQELNLLDLVVGRLATEAEREISREKVIERLRDKAEAETETDMR